jgi:hypothetical protein
MKIMAVEKAVRLQFSQLLGERGFRDLPKVAAERAEPMHILHTDIIENFQFPLPAQYFLQRGHGFAALNRNLIFPHLA